MAHLMILPNSAREKQEFIHSILWKIEQIDDVDFLDSILTVVQDEILLEKISGLVAEGRNNSPVYEKFIYTPAALRLYAQTAKVKKINGNTYKMLNDYAKEKVLEIADVVKIKNNHITANSMINAINLTFDPDVSDIPSQRAMPKRDVIANSIANLFEPGIKFDNGVLELLMYELEKNIVNIMKLAYANALKNKRVQMDARDVSKVSNA
jgi:histone H3/H4